MSEALPHKAVEGSCLLRCHHMQSRSTYARHLRPFSVEEGYSSCHTCAYNGACILQSHTNDQFNRLGCVLGLRTDSRDIKISMTPLVETLVLRRDYIVKIHYIGGILGI